MCDLIVRVKLENEKIIHPKPPQNQYIKCNEKQEKYDHEYEPKYW